MKRPSRPSCARLDDETDQRSAWLRSYDICIGSGLLPHAGELLAPMAQGRRMVVVTDEHVVDHLHILASSLASHGVAVEPIILQPGERSKAGARWKP